jgi:hypothetical protein
VAEVFTGTPGAYVPIAESIRGFKEILEGKHDDIPERAFLLKGTIDEVVADAGGKKESDDESSGEESSEEESEETQTEAKADEESSDEGSGGGDDEE